MPNLTLLQRFMILCAVVLIVAAVVLGERISSNVQRDMARSTAFNTALYIGSVIGTEIQIGEDTLGLTPDSRALLDRLFSPERLGSEIVSIKLWSPTGVVIYSTNRDIIGRQFPLGHDLVEALEGEVFYEMSDEKEENTLERERFDKLIEVYAPIRAQASGKIVGAAEVYQRIDRIPEFIAASRREVWLLMAAAFGLLYAALSGIVRQAGATINRQNAQLREMNRVLEQQSITDFLTGLHNHRYFHEQLQDEVLRATRYEQTFSLIFCDIDRFKALNDIEGHQAGDLALRSTAEAITRALRSTDLAARYGGEEYAIILPQTNLEQALGVAERVRCSVEANPILLPDGREIRVTISVGVSSFPEHGNTKEELIERSDSAMYEAKHAGRNRVVGCPELQAA